jgi:hypothetical protein
MAVRNVISTLTQEGTEVMGPGPDSHDTAHAAPGQQVQQDSASG